MNKLINIILTLVCFGCSNKTDVVNTTTTTNQEVTATVSPNTVQHGMAVATQVSAPATSSDQAHSQLVPNAIAVEGIGVLGGQPSKKAFVSLAAEGYKSIINLRAEPTPFNEKTLSAEIGVAYHHLPIAEAAGINKKNAETLYELLQDENNLPAIVHCASGNRVGALFALFGSEHYGLAPEAAVKFGEATGMTRLKPVVESILK